MAAYIDQVATVESLNAMKPFLRDRGQVQLLRRIMNHIGKIPVADVVPVVRCKDCFWFMAEAGCPLSKSGYFKRGKPLPHENDFCSYGERKDGD